MDLHYIAFGLAIESALAIPELAIGAGPPADVGIHLGVAPESLKQPQAEGVLYQAAPDEFLLRVPGTARYWVHAGREIVIDREPRDSDGEIRVFLLNSVFGALLHQRGILPLHGSAIAGPRGAALFLGQSGCGKSTLAAEFRRLGYRVLADEVCAISLDGNRAPLIWPSYPRLQLWADAAERVGQNLRGAVRLRPAIEKYSVQLEDYSPDAVAISTIYGLHPGNTRELSATPLEGSEKVRELTSNIFRPRFLKGMQTGKPHSHTGELAARTPVLRVVRPHLPYLLDDLAMMLEKDFS